MRDFLKALVAVAVLGLVVTSPFVPMTEAEAEQFVILNKNEVGISANLTFDVDDVAFIVKYIGTVPTGATTVDVEADGDMQFIKNAAADTNIGCTDLNGEMDVSDATCNTLGAVCDRINASAEWRCLPVGIRRGATMDSNVLLVQAAARATVAAGVKIYFDNTATDYANFSLAPRAGGADARDWGIGTSGAVGSTGVGTTARVHPNIPTDPFNGLSSALTFYNTTFTHGGAGTNVVVGVKRDFVPSAFGVGLTAGTAAVATYSETVRTVLTRTAAASTTAESVDFSNAPLIFNVGEWPQVRRADTAQTAGIGSAQGVSWKRGN